MSDISEKTVNKDNSHSINDENHSNIRSIDHESAHSFTFIDETSGASMDSLSHKLKVS